MNNKGLKCRFVGYTESGYRLWNEEENKLIHCRNVIFDESMFGSQKEKLKQKIITSIRRMTMSMKVKMVRIKEKLPPMRFKEEVV